MPGERETILDLLETVWENRPDWSFSQLVDRLGLMFYTSDADVEWQLVTWVEQNIVEPEEG